MNRVTPFVAALVAVTLGGCGDDEGPGEWGTDGGTLPCSDVWKVGATLDLNEYAGCDDGLPQEHAGTHGCYDAAGGYIGQVANYKDRLWVVQKGTDPITGLGEAPGTITDNDPQCRPRPAR